MSETIDSPAEATELLQLFLDLPEDQQKIVVAGFTSLKTNEEKDKWLKRSIKVIKSKP